MEFGNKGLIAFIISIPILGLLLRFIIRKIKVAGAVENNLAVKQSTHGNFNKVLIHEKIIKYFGDYENKIKNYELHNFYSRQFDLDDLIQEYELQNITIRSIKELGITVDKEYQAGNEILIKLAQEIKGQNRQMTWGDALMFLLSYYELTGKRKALREIENRIQDSERYNKYVMDIKDKIKDLVES